MPRATAEEKRDRIARIADMMARNEYRTRITAMELAAEWGVAYETVSGYASEASRLFLIPAEEIEAKRASLAAAFEALAFQAARDRNEMTGLADPVGASKILVEYAKLVGIDLERPPQATGDARPRIEIRVIAEPTTQENEPR